MNKRLRVLNVEDSERGVELIRRHLLRAGYDLVLDSVDTYAAMKSALDAQEWDVILSDYAMPQFNALQALALLKETALDIPFIIISGTIGEAVAVEAMRAGAHDYFIKDNLARLAPAIERELEEAKNRRARKQAEESLKASEAELRALFAAMTDVVLVLDADGRYLRIAPTNPSYLYKPPAELVGKTLHDVFPKEQADFFLAHSREASRTGRMHRVEYLLQVDGKDVWYDSSVSPMSHDSVLWISRDITERKRAEEALRESEERYRLLFEGNPQPMWVFDLETLAFLAVNEDAIQHYGYSRGEFLAMTIKDICPPEELPALLEALASQVAGIDKTGVWGWRHLKKDRGIIDVEITTHQLTFAGRRAELVLVNDVTERKKAEAALREAEEKYRSIFENAVEGIFQSTANGRWISANPAMAHILGHQSPEELMASIPDIERQLYVEPDRRSEYMKLLEEFGIVLGFVMQLYRKDGSKIWVSASTRAVRDASGALIYYEGTIEDITERRQLEEQFRQSQKLEAIGRLAGGVAHDFNNLLTIIIGYSQMALARLRSDDPMHRYIEEIDKAGQRAASLTNQLLTFSRKQVLQPKVLNLNVVVAEIGKMLHRLIGEDIELAISLDPELDQVKADRGQIEQVIMNFAVNARDAMPDGGTLTIETANIVLDESYTNHQHPQVQSGSYVMLAASDTGVGMDKETQSHIFEPFFTTKEQGRGTGLGLSTVFGIVEQSGGHIWVYSEPGRGTTFKVYLPAIKEPVKNANIGEVPAESFRGWETVLLVEDEDGVRGLARKVLEMTGYTVLEARNASEAMQICERQKSPVHLMLTDVVMPGISGSELAECLKVSGHDIKVLYMSGYTDDAVVRLGILSAEIPFLQKPFTPNALAQKLREVLDAT